MGIKALDRLSIVVESGQTDRLTRYVHLTGNRYTHILAPVWSLLNPIISFEKGLSGMAFDLVTRQQRKVYINDARLVKPPHTSEKATLNPASDDVRQHV